jgi:hypothetical protein
MVVGANDRLGRIVTVAEFHLQLALPYNAMTS